MKKKIILSSVLSIVLCLSLITGSTFALFTSEKTVNVAVTAGNVEVTASVENLTLSTSLAVGNLAETSVTESDNTITLSKIVPGDCVTFDLRIKNNSDMTVKYRTVIEKLADDGLWNGLAVTIDGVPYDGSMKVSVWESAAPLSSDIIVPVKVELPETAGNEYLLKSCTFAYTVEAVQGNADVADSWDGSADYSWFLDNPEATEFSLTSSEQFAAFADLVDGSSALAMDGETSLPVTFEGKIVKLESSVDLYMEDENGEPVCFDPIGSYRNEQAFKGTFDGNGYTIKNLNQNTWALDNGYYYGDLGLGLFGLVEDAHIKNLTIDGANISGESAICGIVAACSYGDTTFENITVSNSEGADYQYYSGGIVGWASGNQTFINCVVDESTEIAAQWGDFDNATGGIIGGCGGNATIYLKGCTVACRIDSYNDVTSTYQWYAYRRAGMLIGNTGKTVDENGRTVAAAPQLICEDVTVIYGNWANYHYCEFGGTSWPYVRVEAGVSNSAYSNPRYGVATDANGNKVVDDNHTHNEGEDHNILCVFDQLYGGGQGVFGAPSHEGVTVIYNNK
ncbi:MAG: hypothetical protein E7609_01425 [Ruminococcaceae bacterium]|nr:hypothetical protein [Oscillospiraceae bacterium]